MSDDPVPASAPAASASVTASPRAKRSHRPKHFSKTDLTRALRAALDAGIRKPEVRVNPVTHELVVTVGDPAREKL